MCWRILKIWNEMKDEKKEEEEEIENKNIICFPRFVCYVVWKKKFNYRVEKRSTFVYFKKVRKKTNFHVVFLDTLI